jgi:hypothetical protein
VRARQLIEGVVRLEWTRVYSWARDYVYAEVARPIVTESFHQLLFAAASGAITMDGPYASLVRSTHSQLVAHFKGDAFYLPSTAHLAVPLPTDEELEELCLAYGMLQATAAMLRLSLGELYSLLHHLRTSQGLLDRGPAPAVSVLQETAGYKVQEQLFEAIDGRLHLQDDWYKTGEAWARREYRRSQAWLSTLPAQRSR